jgi:adenine-specific DNA-methyltransferase
MNNTVKNLKSLIKSTLEGDDRLWFVNQDNEQEFNQTLLLDLVEKVDNKIISLLLQEEVLREKFFVKIVPPRPAKLSTPQEGNFSYVFKTNEFRFFMEENKVDNSYTSFKNRIGLTDGKKFLKDSGDIVLDWPYKDCVLEGGQSTEEGVDIYFEYNTKSTPSGKPDTPQEGNYIKKQGKRKEIFFNSVLAQDEIDRLLDPKALVNWKRFTKDGQIPLLSGGDEVDGVDALKRNEDGTIAENLIIKGNNLLALHSLKKQFRGKVKLIYIDPPYNTGNDGFKYNDNFNHSTWLTFMKNRLEVARELLRDDGVIFVSCDDNEQAYLKVLMDEVFGRENFVGNIIRKTGSNRNMGNIGRSLDVRHESLIIFSKKSKVNIFYGIQQDVNDDEIYTQDFTVRTGGFEYEIPSLDFSVKFKRKWAKKEEDFKKMLGGNISSTYEELYKNIIEIKDLGWFKLNDFIFKSKSGIINKIKYKKDKKLVHSLWTDIASQKNVNTHFGALNIEFSNPKLESFIQRIIEISTNPGDIVLDYHLGSGTTCAVAHKMGRQYIGIEQMDYIETIAVERLKKVIGQSTSPAKAGTPQEENIPLVEGWTAKQDGVDSFDTGGISKAVNWQGGGDFVYL